MDEEIFELRKKLEEKTKEVGYDFKNPKVMQISKKLDALIVKHMKQKNDG